MPSIPLDVRQEQEGQPSSAPYHQLTAPNVPTTFQSDGSRQRITKPLPLTRHLSLEPAAVNRPREVSSPFPKATTSRPSPEAHNDDGVDFLVRASEEVLKVHPALDRAYLLDIMEEHYPKCTKDHIVQCTVHHFTNRPDYPRVQEGSKKRKLAEGAIDDGQEAPVTTRRRIGGTSSLASLSDDDDSLECESCRGAYQAKATSSCPAGHLFCHLCIFKAVSSQLNSEEPLVICLDAACTHPFTRATLLDILPHEPLGLYDTLISNHTTRQMQRVDACPQCGWVCPTKPSLPVEQSKRFSCETCGSETCRICKQSAHGLTSCKDAESRRRESQEAGSDSDSSHVPRSLRSQTNTSNLRFLKGSGPSTPDEVETSLPPISPVTDTFSSAGEGPLLPSLRSTLGSSLGKPVSQPSSPSFNFRLNLPPLNAGVPEHKYQGGPIFSELAPRELTDPWRYSLGGDATLSNANPTPWLTTSGPMFRPLHQPSEPGHNSIVHRDVQRLQGELGGSGRSSSRSRTPGRRATFTGRSSTVPPPSVSPTQPLRLSLPFLPGISSPDL
ncbi:hypothetical protein BKA70DRAFT_253612 [Coprinopsis sp. MPI-PUGE-AT-0042]|nr:hypothetical protein BKA70DRAFT_253612 [Coprinopsis sp. MPI-PUGE-AT-0042]